MLPDTGLLLRALEFENKKWHGSSGALRELPGLHWTFSVSVRPDGEHTGGPNLVYMSSDVFIGFRLKHFN